MKKQVTIQDVAKLAGVSVATASRAMNDTGYPVSTKLRQRVKEAAEELEYVPNLMARGLRNDTCRDIGLVIPNVSNPFYLQALMGITDVMNRNGLGMMFCNTNYDAVQERKCLQKLYERQIRGVILSSVNENADVIEEFTKKGMRFVLLDQKFNNEDYPGINFDARTGAKIAVKYLVSEGHRKIAFGTMPITRWSRMEMRKGYQDGLTSAGIDYDKNLVYAADKNDSPDDGNPELQVGHRIAEAFLRDGCPASAILCVNDMVAIGVIHTLQREGIRVPEQISVMGFDDIPMAKAFLPALTTVHYPAQEMGRLAALMIVDILSDRTQEMSLSMKMSPRLVVRNSVSEYKE